MTETTPTAGRDRGRCRRRLSVCAASLGRVDRHSVDSGDGRVRRDTQRGPVRESVAAQVAEQEEAVAGPGPRRAGAPAILSPVAGGLVRTWRGDRTALWRVDDPGRLRVLTAAAWAGRARHRDGRVRAAGEIRRHGTHFRLLLRIGGEHPDAVFTLEPVPQAPEYVDSTMLWDELFTYFAIAVDSAMRRGEALFVGCGDQEDAARPGCFVAALDDGDGPFVVVEADPVPHGNVVWGRVPDDVGACGITVPADMDTVTGAGLYMLECVRYWGVMPWDVVLTRRPHPPGALREAPDGLRYADLGAMRRSAVGGVST